MHPADLPEDLPLVLQNHEQIVYLECSKGTKEAKGMAMSTKHPPH